jgi:hypothetical protein
MAQRAGIPSARPPSMKKAVQLGVALGLLEN